MNKRTRVFTADFETSYDDKKCWVWLAAYSELYKPDNIVYTYSIESFFDSIFEGSDKEIYFHNLAYDGKYILYYLLKQNYTFTTGKMTREKQIKYLIDKNNTYYYIKCSFKNKKGIIHTIMFKDSLKLIPLSLERIAKALNLPIAKGEIDYNKVRYENTGATEEEKEYIKNDVLILKYGLMSLGDKIKYLTIGSETLADYKSMLNKHKDKFTDSEVFVRYFPYLTLKQDKNIRPGYNGGICFLENKYVNKVIKTYTYDINSMYPYIMFAYPLPYGKGHYFKGKWKSSPDKVAIMKVKIACKLKPGYKPNIPSKKTFLCSKWTEEIEAPELKILTNVDLDYIKEAYDIYYLEYISGYEYKASNLLFREYINKYYTIKSTTTDPGERLIAKLHLNCLYGKFGTKIIRQQLLKTIDNNKLKNDILINTHSFGVYLPLAIFVTSYARKYLLNCIHKNINNFIYCDTDSLHLTKSAVGIHIHQSRLGYFKLESITYTKHIKQKCYLSYIIKEYKKNEVLHDTGYKLAVSGLQSKMNKGINFNTFMLGGTFNCLRSLIYPGGCILKQDKVKIL